MIIIQNYDDFLFESYSYNKLSEIISDYIFDLINYNIGKLILNKEITIQLNEVENIKFLNDKINVKLSNRSYGNVNSKTVLIIENYIINMKLNLELEITKSELILKKIDKKNELYSTINHEILHIIELYNTNKKETANTLSWKMGEDLYDLKDKYPNDKNWQKIYYLIYLSLPHKMRAKLQEFNTILKSNGLRGIILNQSFIKTTKIYKNINFLSNVDENNILKKLKLDKNFNSIIKDFSLKFLKSDNLNFENNFLEYFKKIKLKNKKLLIKILRSSYNFENYSEENIDIDYDYFK